MQSSAPSFFAPLVQDRELKRRSVREIGELHSVTRNQVSMNDLAKNDQWPEAIGQLAPIGLRKLQRDKVQHEQGTPHN